MATEHRNLTGADLHEPKGVDIATANQVYVSDGAGSGEWRQIGISEIDATSIRNANKYYFTYELKGIATASNVYIPVIGDSIVRRVYGIINAAITTADAVVNFKNNGATTFASMLIPYTGSAAGQVFSLQPNVNSTILDTNFIYIENVGGSGGTCDLVLTFEMELV